MPTSSTTALTAIAATVVAATAAACGSTPTVPGGNGQVHTVVSMVMLEATGPNPREITVDVGETVSFMNHEGVPFTVAGGASPSQSGCSEINAVGVLRPGDVRATEPFSTAKTCDYHVPNGQAVLFSGRIFVR